MNYNNIIECCLYFKMRIKMTLKYNVKKYELFIFKQQEEYLVKVIIYNKNKKSTFKFYFSKILKKEQIEDLLIKLLNNINDRIFSN